MSSGAPKITFRSEYDQSGRLLLAIPTCGDATEAARTLVTRTHAAFAAVRGDLPSAQQGLYESRLKTELVRLSEAPYAAYLLGIADLLTLARRLRIPVGPGRKSLPGSLVAFVLGLTGVDPIVHGLTLESFWRPNFANVYCDISVCAQERVVLFAAALAQTGGDHRCDTCATQVRLLPDPAVTAVAACVSSLGWPAPSSFVFTELVDGGRLGMPEVDGSLGKGVLRALRPRRFAAVRDAFALLCGWSEKRAQLRDLYIRGREGAQSLVDPLLSPFVAATHGVFLYDEQVRGALATLADCSLSMAESIRRAITEEWAHSFTVGALKRRGLTAARAERVWQQLWHVAGSTGRKGYLTGRTILALEAATLRAHAPDVYARALARALETSANDNLCPGEAR